MTMVALVLVSHSRALAAALAHTLRKLYGDKAPRIAVAAGVGEDGEELGTDATAILAAIEEVAVEADGVLVLLDLGSAVLSAEFALDLLEESLRGKVVLCPAPLVEGAIAAAAQCGVGATLAEVRAEAESALRQKIQHLAAAAPPPDGAPALGADVESVTTTLRVENPNGLHARPAMRIVQTAAGFASTVQIENLRTGGPPASTRSLVAINCLDARQGDTIRVTARGTDAVAAIRALETLHAEGFGDTPLALEKKSPGQSERQGPGSVLSPLPEDHRWQGVPLSAGIAVGKLHFVLDKAPQLTPPTVVSDPPREVARLHGALASVRRKLEESAAAMSAKLGPENAAIFLAHRMLADDPSLIERAVWLIEQDRLPAEHAWQQASQSAADAYRRLELPLLRERARDVEDLSLRVLRALGAAPALRLGLPDETCVLVVPTILPSEVAALDPARVPGVIAGSIGSTSHAAILLRAAGIAVVDGVDLAQFHETAEARQSVDVALDGETGEIWLDPDETVRLELGARQQAAAAAVEVSSAERATPLHTRDGTRIELASNVASAPEALAAARAGAEAIGLLRTEFLFFDRLEAPTEDEQTAALRAIALAMPLGAPVTMRTFDIGGDKPVAYLPVPVEQNPFLGVRGLRLALLRGDLFMVHLRAILRAAHGHRFRIMFPMVTEVEEIRRARALLGQAHDQLAEEGTPHAWPVEVGMMVEVPAAALNAHTFVNEVDFFSIGTNDLTQYTLAAERGHPQMGRYGDAIHPAVLRLIARTAAIAARSGKWVGVCGEAAADPTAAGIFLGLGVRELSVGVAALGRLRRLVGDTSCQENRIKARRCLKAASAIEAREIWSKNT